MKRQAGGARGAAAACLLLAAVLAAGPGRSASAGPAADAAQDGERVFSTLRPGRYAVILEGWLCAACGEAAAEAVSMLDGVERAEADFEKRMLIVEVGRERSVPVASLTRALRRAAARINLDTDFRIVRIRYIP